MSITSNNPADFTPDMGNYKTLQPFRYWCQKVLPLVYDNSLSYYELLCKVVDYLNKAMEDVETLYGDVTNLHTAYVELQSYVNNYFSTLDVQQEINNKLDNMANNGTLTSILYGFILQNDTIYMHTKSLIYSNYYFDGCEYFKGYLIASMRTPKEYKLVKINLNDGNIINEAKTSAPLNQIFKKDGSLYGVYSGKLYTINEELVMNETKVFDKNYNIGCYNDRYIFGYLENNILYIDTLDETFNVVNSYTTYVPINVDAVQQIIKYNGMYLVVCYACVLVLDPLSFSVKKTIQINSINNNGVIVKESQAIFTDGTNYYIASVTSTADQYANFISGLKITENFERPVNVYDGAFNYTVYFGNNSANSCDGSQNKPYPSLSVALLNKWANVIDGSGLTVTTGNIANRKLTLNNATYDKLYLTNSIIFLNSNVSGRLEAHNSIIISSLDITAKTVVLDNCYVKCPTFNCGTVGYNVSNTHIDCSSYYANFKGVTSVTFNTLRSASSSTNLADYSGLRNVLVNKSINGSNRRVSSTDIINLSTDTIIEKTHVMTDGTIVYEKTNYKSTGNYT